MKKIFFDTWGWVAIAHKDDDRHAEALSFYKTFLLKNGTPVTTDYVLAETITLLRAKTRGVEVFVDAVLAAIKEERIMLARIDAARWDKTWTLGKKYHDKPSLSFVDLSSFVVMKELGVSDVLTADKHFEDASLGFKKLF
jgi:uncharacterized protein